MKAAKILSQKVLAAKACTLIFALPITKREDLVAQLVEQYTFNVWALGSSPSGITNWVVGR
jgi:hypothetical protein